ncbi:MAG: DNA alkylation repair protein [Candidatus Doudnabacteria bacterium RIFCSPHIGHO2_02_FULL_48_21]|uniref:DNA alkylation repair protein n=1 Tax=Candidatus Doudnabacteria bacterium RIFCSPLOWO2_02_FULL_48_13 TaxID=1817845 RepID=A0A1F5Q8B2_9BACT|nr:MAG: DNA alkylation repair protein [Candidatus Doudnabacteria bacterium RIFCSPHIGHO2_01_FULL_48_180]OGE91140.1 MAG: DNA alkylation repair protein [Candidatus Doudnabacteria bacterium RIFCSPHIGHO2_12_FULL_47_25]OGE93870.1 MAG: DNA alkylation repair protein [Candidatus Doudnabacteria bacterium RIFCSPHIGHO2_02_FULL_48_21]OGE97115.1 MAG: DNA alkylation repair protein [Candidatus Doudnabacteria bacterium RIFCSPLOWO2_01_FULL_48_57]OGE98366.1 MAG: DNA alkylation repair protein [Candidatus Doudnabac
MINNIRKLASPNRAQTLRRFFKTGKGQYGEGDKFLGLTVPQCRRIAKKATVVNFVAIAKLLRSKYHEERLIALLILTYRFEKSADRTRKRIFDFYLKNTEWVNNWDLVDLSSYKIVGEYLLGKPRRILYRLAKSKNIWERRIAIISTLAFIRQEQYADTLKIAKILLSDKHDLIHKATGWMLREMGKRFEAGLVEFLNQNAARMPRTTLRYAIERFPEKQRKQYLAIGK